MKQAQYKQTSLASIGGRCFAAVALCALTLAPVFAFGGDLRDKDTQDPDQGVAIGDETIGTLPILNGGSTIELVRGLPITRPSLFLEGDLYELQNAISFFQGFAHAEVMPLDPNWQRVRLVFVDEVLLGFDRVALLGADIQFGLWMPESTRSLNPSLSWGGRTIGVQPTDSRVMLPLSQMSATGALDASPLCAAAGSSVGMNAVLAAVDQDFLYLVQRH
jgi:hypothetical protein